MKRIKSVATLFLAMVLLFAFEMESGLADQILQVQVKAEYKYNDARKMLDLINKFRTGKDAWILSEDGSTKVKVNGLRELQYDYNLERVAMQRALELAVFFSHTRPDGSAWKTAFPGSYSTRGENMAYGSGSVDSIFRALMEEDCDYEHQGHRRNMLRKEYTRVGFGAVKVGNVVYWAQSFGGGSGSLGADSNRFNSYEVTASLDLLVRNAKNITSDQDELIITKGDSVSLPQVVIYSNSGAQITLRDVIWETKDSGVAKITNKKVSGVKAGNTTLETTVSSVTVSLSVQVTDKVSDDLIGEIIEDYDPPLYGEFLFVLEDDECFDIE